jgi:hypothetical protein
VRARDRQRFNHLKDVLRRFAMSCPCPGIANDNACNTFVEQVIESERRIRFVEIYRDGKEISQHRADPSSEFFDPIKAAILHARSNCLDEASWLVFLATHFGKNSKGGWRYCREVYLGNGGIEIWNWQRISTSTREFRSWLRANNVRISRETPRGGFGNHRKYESLNADSESGTGTVIQSYVELISQYGSHQAFFESGTLPANQTPPFRTIYNALTAVRRFGRTAKFDYLTMLRKVGAINIFPDSPYIIEATGPRAGAELMFSATPKALRGHQLERRAIELGNALRVDMQVVEDSLCNWQKSPEIFVPFRG